MSDPTPATGIAPTIPATPAPVPTPPPAVPAAPPAAPAAVEQPPSPEPPKPTETVEFWRDQARKQEQRAKDNATAAQRLAELEQQQMTDAERAAAATAQAQADAQAARDEATRYRVAAAHGIGADHFDLLGSGDESAVTERALRLQPLIAAAAEVVQLRAENAALREGKPAPMTPQTLAGLHPGAIPQGAQTEDDINYAKLFGSA